MNHPEFVVRIKLPSASGFASCPSGDTDYEEAYDKVLRRSLPVGFEYKYPRTGQHWSIDSEGYTLALLRCSDEKNALASALDTIKALRKRLEKIETAVGGR